MPWMRRSDNILALHAQGMSIRAVACPTGLSRNTVTKVSLGRRTGIAGQDNRNLRSRIPSNPKYFTRSALASRTAPTGPEPDSARTVGGRLPLTAVAVGLGPKGVGDRMGVCCVTAQAMIENPMQAHTENRLVAGYDALGTMIQLLLISTCHERGSMSLTPNRHFAQWGDVFANRSLLRPSLPACRTTTT